MKKIITFESIHYTIKADQLLRTTSCRYEIVPTPRDVSTDCGMCIKVNVDDFDLAFTILSEQGFQVKVYEL